ncbi:hypothetical protein [Brachybacterium sp. FME24]|uniref:hypothetical protein n=1 Tax=Brachybacterium sp. FME24 TaxID=2742605 RepID=UPI001868B451|nr:hypothetical protein [Brachybacterium sp. FME24]
MNFSGASSLPDPGGRSDQADLPGLEELRVALRPPELPLPSPRDVLEAAHRVRDLVHAERFRDARALADAFRGRPAVPEDRLALLREALRGAVLMDDAEQVELEAADIVSVLHRSGHPEQAAATVAVLLERGPTRGRSSVATKAVLARAAPEPERSEGSTSAAASSSRRGRRRGERAEVSAELLSVVRGLEQTVLPAAGGPRGGAVDPRRAVVWLRAALTALPAVRPVLLGDPDLELRLRLAQALEAVGDPVGATTQALDVLELVEREEAVVESPLPDPQRTATAAHALLSRTLGLEHPVSAVRHSLDALGALHEVDDPPLRVGLITQLLQALMAAGATDQASFTAGRLASLQRTVQRDALRIGPLLAVAAQRVQAERYEAAWVPLERARRIAGEQRDHRSSLEASRLAASIHERTADHPAALTELHRVASEARWLADDLATAGHERAELVRTELSAHALVLRRALDLGRTTLVHEAAAAIERRTRPEGGRPLLPPELLWDHRVDARVGLLIAIGEALRREDEGVEFAEYESRRRAVLQVIDQVPAGHDARARYWAAYVDDHHARVLADRGQDVPALRAAHRARDGWVHLGNAEDIGRLDELIAQLQAD